MRGLDERGPRLVGVERDARLEVHALSLLARVVVECDPLTGSVRGALRLRRRDRGVVFDPDVVPRLQGARVVQEALAVRVLRGVTA